MPDVPVLPAPFTCVAALGGMRSVRKRFSGKNTCFAHAFSNFIRQNQQKCQQPIKQNPFEISGFDLTR
ncbi:hypothetical protein C7N43_35780 [Sphingobacteriales bacterium UPWRP_1]|nr:hypothetical protein C7N43_35780 [Sphingobacteriales bacterium UPWRP_1]